MMNKSFFTLVFGQSCANLADVWYVVALVTFIYNQTGSATATALIPFLVNIAMFAGGIFAPALIDRVSLKQGLAWSQLGKTLLLVGLIGFIHIFTGPVWVILLLMMCISLLDSIANPIRNTCVPILVGDEQLHRANSLIASIDQMVRLGAWPLGGILIAAFHSTTLLFICLFFYTLATVFMFVLNVETPTRSRLEAPPMLTSIREGWQLTFKSSVLKGLTWVSFLEGLATGVWIAAILYVYVEQQLHLSQAWWGYINAVFFGGMIIGSLLSAKYSARFQPAHYGMIIFYSSLFLALMTLSFGHTTVGWIALLLSGLYGVGEQMKVIIIQTTLQKSASLDALPKIFSVQNVIATVSFGASTLLLSAITDYFGVIRAFDISALLLCCSAFAIFRVRHHFTSSAMTNYETTIS